MQRGSPEFPGRSQHSRQPVAAAGSLQGQKDRGLGGQGSVGVRAETQSRNEIQHLLTSRLPFPAVGPAPLTSKHQQCAQQGKFHGPSAEQWAQLLEVPFHAGSLLYQRSRTQQSPPLSFPAPTRGHALSNSCF